MILRIRIFMNRKILILRIFLRKMTILRKILGIGLILRISMFVNTGPVEQLRLRQVFSIVTCGCQTHTEVTGCDWMPRPTNPLDEI